MLDRYQRLRIVEQELVLGRNTHGWRSRHLFSRGLGCFLGCGGNARLETDDTYLRRVRNVFGIVAYVVGGKTYATYFVTLLNDQVGMVAAEQERHDSSFDVAAEAAAEVVAAHSPDLYGFKDENEPNHEADPPER